MMRYLAITLMMGLFLVPWVIAEVSSSSINWMSRQEADSLYCAINDCGGGGSTNVTIQSNSTESIYAEMYNYTSGGFTFTPAASGVYYNMTGLICGALNGVSCTITATHNYFTIHDAGMYAVNLHFSGIGNAAGGEYGVVVAKNFDETISRNCYINIDGTNTHDTIGISCLLNLSVDDTVSIKVEDEAAPPKAFDVHSVNLNIAKLDFYNGTPEYPYLWVNNSGVSKSVQNQVLINGSLNMNRSPIYNITELAFHKDDDLRIGYNTSTYSPIGTCTAIGLRASCIGDSALSLGENAQAAIQNAISIGVSSKSQGDGTVVIGGAGLANDTGGSTVDYGVCIGFSCFINSLYAIAIGWDSKSTAQHGIAIGNQAHANATNSIAIGHGVINNVPDSVKIGQNSVYIHSDGWINATTNITAGQNFCLAGSSLDGRCRDQWYFYNNSLGAGRLTNEMIGQINYNVSEGPVKYFSSTNYIEARFFAEADVDENTWGRFYVDSSKTMFNSHSTLPLQLWAGDGSYIFGDATESDSPIINFYTSGNDGQLQWDRSNDWFDVFDDIYMGAGECIYLGGNCVSDWLQVNQTNNISKYWNKSLDKIWTKNLVNISENRLVMVRNNSNGLPTVSIINYMHSGVGQLFNFDAYNRQDSGIALVMDALVANDAKGGGNIFGLDFDIDHNVALEGATLTMYGSDFSFLALPSTMGVGDVNRYGHLVDYPKSTVLLGNSSMRDYGLFVRNAGHSFGFPAIVDSFIDYDFRGLNIEVNNLGSNTGNATAVGLYIDDFSRSTLTKYNNSHAIYIEGGDIHTGGGVNISENITVHGAINSNNTCGIPSAVLTYERSSPGSNQAMAMGNGDALQGSAQACGGTVTALTGVCENCALGDQIAMELRINGVSQTCDTASLVSNYDVDIVDCNVEFDAEDRIGCYTKTETGTVTGIICTIYLRYN